MKKLASIGELPAEEAEAVSAAQDAAASAASAGTGAQWRPSSAQAGQPVLGPVRRVRSHHHRHRRFRMERLDEIRHREDFRALAFILPLIMLLVGMGIVGATYRNPDPEMRPAKLVSLAWAFVALGGGWFAVSSCVGAVRSWKEARKRAKEEQEDAASNPEWRRRRHRRHRHVHGHGGSSSSYAGSFSRRSSAQEPAGGSSTDSPAPAGGEA